MTIYAFMDNNIFMLYSDHIEACAQMADILQTALCKCIFLNENIQILTEISFRCKPIK